MNLDDHPILTAYLFGCLFAFFLHFVVTAEHYLVSWFFKGNVFRKNLKKIQNPEGQTFLAEAGVFAFLLFVSTIFSWLAVLQFAFQIFWIPIKAIREVLSSVPEEIKAIRFPLLNNPELSRESVWAYLYALNTKGGVIPNAWAINGDLDEIGNYYPSFDKHLALEILGSLKVVDPEIVANVNFQLANKEQETQELSGQEFDSDAEASPNKPLSEDELLQLQDDFERRLESEIDLPDAIRQKDAYIYWNLMRRWFITLTAKYRNDDENKEQLQHDWRDYIETLPKLKTAQYLERELEDTSQAAMNEQDTDLMSNYILFIQNEFAAAIGEDAVEELHSIRGRDADAFDRSGKRPMAPIGYHYFPVSISPYIEECQPKGVHDPAVRP